jgi:hypothetical protein
MPSPRPSPAWLGRGALALLVHPGLWSTGLRQVRVLARPGWWRRSPFLPLPDADYLRFRMETAYGGAGDEPLRPQDLLAYLRWCRAVREAG